MQSWARYHSNGWRTFVDKIADDKFTARALHPDQGAAFSTEHPTLASALEAADRRASGRTEHACDCPSWFQRTSSDG